MITGFLIQMTGALFTALLSLLPSWSVDTSTVTTMDHTGVSFASLNNWVPEQMAFICLLIALGVRLFFLAWTGVLFLYRLIPFNG